MLVTPAGALADCAVDGYGQPDLPEARENVFIGTVIGETTVRHESGPPRRPDAYVMRVGRVFAGHMPARAELVPLCAPITLERGELYIIGSSEAARDADHGWLMLNDRSAVAWRVYPDNGVDLQSFGVPVSDMSAHYRTPGSVRAVLDLLAPGSDGALPDTSTSDPEAPGASGAITLLALVVGVLAAVGLSRRARTLPGGVTARPSERRSR